LRDAPAPRAERSNGVNHASPTETPRAEHSKAEISFETEKDRRFAEFVAKTTGDMVQKIAVGIDRDGIMRVQVGKATAPEDTLPLTKSLLAGARKDFPNKPITLSVFDPDGEPILKAHYRPEDGVRYEVVRGSADGHTEKTKPTDQVNTAQASAKSGTTEKDRKFAEWAKAKGQPYLRYVQADLERTGRVWFGITKEVQPKDVGDLTKSLLQGAHTEFPRRELTATVFDPEGERIGKATLEKDGKVHWSK